jgi:hypothetical protein
VVVNNIKVNISLQCLSGSNVLNIRKNIHVGGEAMPETGSNIALNTKIHKPVAVILDAPK